MGLPGEILNEVEESFIAFLLVLLIEEVDVEGVVVVIVLGEESFFNLGEI